MNLHEASKYIDKIPPKTALLVKDLVIEMRPVLTGRETIDHCYASDYFTRDGEFLMTERIGEKESFVKREAIKIHQFHVMGPDRKADRDEPKYRSLYVAYTPQVEALLGIPLSTYAQGIKDLEAMVSQSHKERDRLSTELAVTRGQYNTLLGRVMKFNNLPWYKKLWAIFKEGV